MIALSMIALGDKEEAPQIKRALASVMPYLNAAYITLTGPKDTLKETEEVLKEAEEKYLKPIHVSYERDKSRFTFTKKEIKWLTDFLGWEPMAKDNESIFLFNEARNFNLEQIDKEKYKWMLWIDADDIFRGGDQIKKILDEAEREGIEAIYFNYIYQAEIEDNKLKNVIIEHLRERIVLTDGSFRWVAPIHETLIETRPTKKKDFIDCDVLHLAEAPAREKSLYRNIKALEYSIFQTEGKDPRPLYYLAKAYYDLGTLHQDFSYDEMAKKLIYLYLRGPNPSGWAEERSQACEYLVEIYRRGGRNKESIVEAMNALIESESPTVFVNLAQTYQAKGEWERALLWIKIAMQVEGKQTTLVLNPKDTQAKVLEVLYNCHLNLGHIKEAWAAATKLLEMYPNEPNVQKSFEFVEMLRQEKDITQKIVDLHNYLLKAGEANKIKPLLAACPQIAFNNPYIQDLFKKNYPPKHWAENEIAIVCGQGFTPWSAKSLTNPGGSFVGGSEEAVILLSKELTKLGWKVTVYNDPGADEGEIDGVDYKYYYKFNPLDHFNILVSWRYPELADNNFNCKKLILWAHDILNPLVFTKERVDKYDKIIVQSKWHRDNIPEVPENKVLISSNGIV